MIYRFFTLVILLFLTCAFCFGQSTQQKGVEIATEYERRDTGWVDSTANVKMSLKRKNGNQSYRKFQLKLLEAVDSGDKSLVVFNEPKDIRGTAFLSYSHALKPDDQWLFLPALKRVKRITSSKKTGRFMGSEFSYEDMSSFQVVKYAFNYLRDDIHAGKAVYVVDATPKDSNSGYSKLTYFIDKAEYRLYKCDFYDKGGKLLKTLDIEHYKKYNNQFWRADKWKMTNHKSSSVTSLEFSQHQFSQQLKEVDFKKSSLDRGL